MKNGKGGAAWPLSRATPPKTNRQQADRRLLRTRARCARVLVLTEEEQNAAVFATEGRLRSSSPRRCSHAKTSRATQGVAVMSAEARSSVLERAAFGSPSPAIQNPARYRMRRIPAAGALLREDDLEEKQMTLEL